LIGHIITTVASISVKLIVVLTYIGYIFDYLQGLHFAA
jgi:hypothetical protein